MQERRVSMRCVPTRAGRFGTVKTVRQQIAWKLASQSSKSISDDAGSPISGLRVPNEGSGGLTLPAQTEFPQESDWQSFFDLLPKITPILAAVAASSSATRR